MIGKSFRVRGHYMSYSISVMIPPVSNEEMYKNCSKLSKLYTFNQQPSQNKDKYKDKNKDRDENKTEDGCCIIL